MTKHPRYLGHRRLARLVKVRRLVLERIRHAAEGEVIDGRMHARAVERERAAREKLELLLGLLHWEMEEREEREGADARNMGIQK